MAYFSNGAEGADYQANFCSRCVHDADQDCPVWLAHLVYNGKQSNEHVAGILNELIPRESAYVNGQCRMFIERQDAR